jgi:hypothetical protein
VSLHIRGGQESPRTYLLRCEWCSESLDASDEVNVKARAYAAGWYAVGAIHDQCRNCHSDQIGQHTINAVEHAMALVHNDPEV